MTNSRHLPRRLHPPLWGVLLGVMFVGAIGGELVFDISWLVVVPICVAAAWSFYIHFFIKCPTCGHRMRPRDVTDPWTAMRRVLYDCHRCDTEWISDITYSEGADGGLSRA